MKRIVTLLLAAGLVLGAAAGSQAADIKAKGIWQNNLSWADRSPNTVENNDYFRASTRLRTQIDVIASESLKGVIFFEIGHQNWGEAASGAAFGTNGDSKNSRTVEVRYSYVDWIIPQTDAQVRVGLQPFALPTYAVPSAVLDGQGAGITVSGQFNDNFGASLFWLRAYDDYSNRVSNGYNKHDAMDVIGATVPLTFDGVKVTPFGMYSVIGRDTEFGAGWNNKNSVGAGLLPAGMTGTTAASDAHGNAWWAGITGELTAFDPFRVAADFAYGSVDMGKVSGTDQDLKRSGWYAALSADYKLDFMTPGLVFWYASGDNHDVMDGSERMPVMDSDVALTSYGFDGGTYNRSATYNGTSLGGTWGIVAQLKDISFVEDLTHVLRVGYVKGTNNSEMVRHGGVTGITGVGNDLYLTTKDALWEVNLDTQYNIYKDLSLVFELGYINLNYDKDLWGDDRYDRNNFKAAMSLNYKF